MSRSFVKLQEESLHIDSAIISGLPFAVVCKFYGTEEGGADVSDTLIAINDKSSEVNKNYHTIYLRHATTDLKVRILSVSDTANVGEYATADYTADTWHHACGIWVTTTDRRAFLNGANKGVSTGSCDPTGLDRVSIGKRGYATPAAFMGGRVAEAAIWDLSQWPGATNSDKADNFEKILPSLAKGFSPDTYPLGLLAHWDLIRDLKDKVGGYNLTASGTLVAPHPRIIVPIGPQFNIKAGEVKEIAGTVAGQSSVTGLIKISKELAGTVAAACGISGLVKTTRKVVGTITTESTVTGTLAVEEEVAGTIAATSTVAGGMKNLRKVAGTITCSSGISGSLEIVKKVAGTVAATSSVSGTITTTNDVAGTVATVSTVSGILKCSRKVIGTVTATTVVSGTVAGIWQLATTCAIQSVVTGRLYAIGGLSDFAEDKILDHIVGEAVFTKPTTYIGLCTGSPGEEGTGEDCNEVADTNNYSRVAVDWDSATGGTISNLSAITFSTASGSWGSVSHYALFDSIGHGTGNMLIYDELDAPADIDSDDAPCFAAGELELVLT